MAGFLGFVFLALALRGSASTSDKHQAAHSSDHAATKTHGNAVDQERHPEEEAAAAAGPLRLPLPMSGEAPDAYLRQFVGTWIPHGQGVQNDKQWHDVIMKHYATTYQQYLHNWQHLKDATSDAPASASDCNSLECLKRWKKGQFAQIKEFVPEVFQSRAEGSVQHSFQRFADRLKQAQQPSNASQTAPIATELAVASAQPASIKEWWENFIEQREAMAQDFREDTKRLQKEFMSSPASAAACKTVGQLKAWRDGQLARIKSFVPKAFRGFASDSVDSEFHSNKQRIEQEEAASKAHEASGNESARPVELTAALTLPLTETESGSGAILIPHGAAQKSLDDFLKQWVPQAHDSDRTTAEGIINHFTGRWVPEVRNASDRHEWQEKFMSRYREASKDYAGLEQQLQRRFPNTPEDASDCHSLAALKQWREAQKARVAAFVPHTLQKMAEEGVERDYKVNQARITKEQKQDQQLEGSNATATAVQSVAMVAEAEGPFAAASTKDYIEQWIPSPNRRVPEWVPSPAGASHAPVWSLHQEGMHSPRWYADRAAGKSAAWRESFLARYNEGWRHYKDEEEKMQKEFSGAPQHASQAQDVKDLEAWRSAQLAHIHAFVPPVFRKMATDAVHEVSHKHLARILGQSQAGEEQHHSQGKAQKSEGQSHAHADSHSSTKSSVKGKAPSTLALSLGGQAVETLGLGAVAVAATVVAFLVGYRRSSQHHQDEDVYVQV